MLRDTAKQTQDIATLSRNVEHANNALSPILNKEKEQKRLKQAQLVGEIGTQVMDIVRTEGELKAQKAAEAKGDSKVKRPQEGDSAKEWEVYKKALTESPTYKAEMQKYGTGSDFQRAAQAATAAIQALAGGDIQKAIASGASPYLAQLVKDVTIPKDESKITASDIAANAMAHAVVGAVVAQLSGQDVAVGAIGASSGELAARAIMAAQYPGKTANDLTEEEKQSVSALSTLASGLVSGLASNSTASAASGAQSGRNAVENNYLSAKEAENKTVLERKEKAGTLTTEEAKELADTRQLDKERDHAIRDICTQGNKSGAGCSALVAQAQQALNSYGDNVSYSLIYKDLYPQDAANASTILNGLDAGSITRDAAITAIAKANNKDWNEVASEYDRAMQLHGLVSALAGFKFKGLATEVSELSVAANVAKKVEQGAPATAGTKIDSKVTLTQKDSLPNNVTKSFKDGNYQTVITNEPVVVYRKFGGTLDQAKLDGGYATTEQNVGRNETAVYKKWSTSQFEAQIKIPENTKINIGIVGEQRPGSEKPKYDGGADQILMPLDYPLKCVKSVRDGKTGKVYTYDEFRKAFPDQVTKKR
ncbi:VENN motif pre-toxin domain-containing protein [Pectobacterium brasiliense]|uniref:VENN motif pre-toxin domain-containing protein n=1 Tax=Pectobacterium brasiliense TaxID=180957 RepID=UPI00068D796F|nr:VENN motif pre-toxin domain-containing protein [Pectobacterium brasiliense]